jgi:hypothetical protein
MATATDSLMLCFLLLVFFHKHITFNNLTKCIIWTSIIGNNSPELSYDAVILKDRQKDIKLVLTAMASYCTKGKKGLLSLKEMCGVMCTDC